MTSLPPGLSYAGQYRPTSQVYFLHDDTWVDHEARRRVHQTIFDEVFRLISSAQKFILIDMFLYNDFQGQSPEYTRRLAAESTSLLIARQQSFPDMTIIVITDPVNTVYGGLNSIHFDALREQGITVVMTDLDLLPDSNLAYSLIWRLLIKPFGNGQAQTLPNPFGAGRVSIRSWLRLINFKANHRKVVICDQGDSYLGLVTSGNPHDGSSAHRNVALVFDGDAVADLWHTEAAILALQGIPIPTFALPGSIALRVPSGSQQELRVLTEGRIKEALLMQLNSVQPGDSVDLMMFYLSDRQVIQALKRAAEAGVTVRLILDPNKDAFGFKKNGIPNRPVARELQAAGIPVRWRDTHGEQCHVKMIILHRNMGISELMLGSANITRRNLDNFNLETNVQFRGPRTNQALQQAARMFDTYWHNEDGRLFTVPFDHYREDSRLKYWLYRFQEVTGMSAF
jgi:hypothetical protein